MATSRKLTYGSYEVLQNPDGSPFALGAGSYGITYKARHVLLDRINALKVIGEDLLKRGGEQDQEANNRFLSEIRAVGNLQHPGIAMVYDCGLDKGFFYFALEYCDGGTLHQWCEQHGPMPWPEVRQIALQVASAMDYAHANGFLHHDVKPANIMLDGTGQARQAKLIDFGLATNFLRDSAASSSTGHVGQEHFRGNFATASPEQILEHPLDGRSDLFSLGITLWWLLIGRNPFAGVKRGALIAERVSPASYVPVVPGELDASVRILLDGLLEKVPERRIASAREVIERLDATPVGEIPVELASPDIALVPLTIPPDYEVAYTHTGTLAAVSQAKLYVGRHKNTQRQVIAIIPFPSLDTDALAGLRVAASRKLDFGTYEFLDWCMLGTDDVFVISKPDGCSLLAVLRKFGPARFADAMPLLARLARCFDASRAWTTFGLQMDPRDILLRTRDGQPALEHFHGWSDLDPRTARCLPFFTAAIEQGTSTETTLTSSALEFPPLAQFAALAYRMLSGSAVRYAAFFTANGYVMASGLSENGNALLAKAICMPESHASACAFLQALARAEALNVAALAPLVDPPGSSEIASGKLAPVAATDKRAAREELTQAVRAAAQMRLLGPYAESPGAVTEGFHNSAGMRMEPVSSGKFVQGSPVAEREGLAADDEAPRSVRISHHFWMGAHEVTQSAWCEIMGPVSGDDYLGDEMPAHSVTWDEANEFCSRLTRREHELKVLPESMEYRLPTEAEWEYACRAGTTTARYGPVEKIACVSERRMRKTGCFEPNDWNLYDMLGNCFEWCLDSYLIPYPELKGKASDPVHYDPQAPKVIRGGCFQSGPEYARAAARTKVAADRRSARISFRVVLALSDHNPLTPYLAKTKPAG